METADIKNIDLLNYIKKECEARGYDCILTKAQVLLFFAHMYSLEKYGKPLIKGQFMALQGSCDEIYRRLQVLCDKDQGN